MSLLLQEMQFSKKKLFEGKQSLALIGAVPRIYGWADAIKSKFIAIKHDS